MPRSCADCNTDLPGGRARSPRCESCLRARKAHTHKMAMRGWRGRNRTLAREQKAEWDLRRQYGLTLAEYEALAAAQGGNCAICNEPGRMGRGLRRVLHVDHCHATGAIRGLLCHACNTGIGLFRDNPDRLARAREYLLSRDAAGD